MSRFYLDTNCFFGFTFEGQAYHYKVLPFGLSLSLHVFTLVTEAALALLREVAICILDYLGEWVILVHSRDLLCAHRDLVSMCIWHINCLE